MTRKITILIATIAMTTLFAQANEESNNTVAKTTDSAMQAAQEAVDATSESNETTQVTTEEK